jgi:hypothetical protein
MTPMQEVLRQMVAELIDLRSSVDVLLAPPNTLGGALDSKKQAIEKNKKAYANLLEKIGKLT